MKGEREGSFFYCFLGKSSLKIILLFLFLFLLLGKNVCSLGRFFYICAVVDFENPAEREHFSEAANVRGFSLQRRNKQNKRSCVYGEL